jgi:hypothetical protein
LPEKPAACSGRFHRIDQLDNRLVDEIASRTLKRRDVKALGAARDSREYRCRIALRARWAWKGNHIARRGQAGALQNSQSPVVAEPCGDGTSMEPPPDYRCSILLIFEKVMNKAGIFRNLAEARLKQLDPIIGIEMHDL